MILIHIIWMYISHFFPNDLTLALCFIFLLDRKQIQAIFFFNLSSKGIIKQQRQFTTSTMHLAQELLTNTKCSGGSRSSANYTRDLKMRSTAANCQKQITNWEESSKLILLQLLMKLSKNWISTILQSLGIWSKLERWKGLVSGCLKSWPRIIKNRRFEVSSFILHNHHKPFLNWIVMCMKK